MMFFKIINLLIDYGNWKNTPIVSYSWYCLSNSDWILCRFVLVRIHTPAVIELNPPHNIFFRYVNNFVETIQSFYVICWQADRNKTIETWNPMKSIGKLHASLIRLDFIENIGILIFFAAILHELTYLRSNFFSLFFPQMYRVTHSIKRSVYAIHHFIEWETKGARKKGWK